MTNILVAGGAGYIGSHTCLDLFEKGFTPVTYDNLSNGHAEFVQWGPFEHGDIRDRKRLDEVLRKYRPAAIVHFAALIEVGASVKTPADFFDNNVSGTITLVQAAKSAGIDKLVFSSTCATYGLPCSIPMAESHGQQPINPYGRSKLMVEQILGDLDKYEQFRSVCLRYFNAAGADRDARIGEWHDPETHAVPLAIRSAMEQRPFKIFGMDYDTRDGSCIRDYIHVADLADAHSRAVRYLLDGGNSIALNLGTGKGTTVRELLDTIRAVSGTHIPIDIAERRQGDAPVLVADNTLAGEILGWTPRHDLRSIIETAWRWHMKLKDGVRKDMPTPAALRIHKN